MKNISKYQRFIWSLGLFVLGCLAIFCFLLLESKRSIPIVVLDDGVTIPNADEYLKLNYTLQPSKKIYGKEEPLFFTLFVSNTSDKALCVLARRGFTDYSIMKKNASGKELPVTLLPTMVSRQNYHPRHPIIELRPGEKVAIKTGSSLSPKVSLFKPEKGGYYACVHIDSILPGMKYMPPIQSNTVSFEIN